MNWPEPDKNSFAIPEDPFFIEKIELVEILMLPNQISNSSNSEGLDWILFDLWKSMCRKFMIDNEYQYIYFDYYHSYENQEPWEDRIEEVRRARKNAELWIESARKEFQEFCKPLFSIVADRKTYGKHYPRFKESEDSMRNRSNKDAILLPEYSHELQSTLLTKLIEHFFPIILTNKDVVLIVEREKLTGFSEGKDSTRLVCKINSTTSLAHFYPFHDNEFYKYDKEYKDYLWYDSTLALVDTDEFPHLEKNKISNVLKIAD